MQRHCGCALPILSGMSFQHIKEINFKGTGQQIQTLFILFLVFKMSEHGYINFVYFLRTCIICKWLISFE